MSPIRILPVDAWGGRNVMVLWTPQPHFIMDRAASLHRLRKLEEIEIFLMTHQRGPDPSGRQISVLIVDDDPDVLVYFRRVLEGCSCLVTEAASGRQALRRVEDGFFDVVLTDLSLPDIDGFALTETIRENLPNVRVIHTSGYTSEYFDSAARRHGFKSSIDKASIGPGELAALVWGGAWRSQR